MDNKYLLKLWMQKIPVYSIYFWINRQTKGMVHTTAGYMVYTAYTFKNVFNYEENDVYWCTADIGWITGHSYILYGPLLNGATTVILKGFLHIQILVVLGIIEKHQVNQFYTAPTAIRALAKKVLIMYKSFH